ncbi:Fe-Mn family superoxide dismutase [Rugosibacter aromaticivorans]|nr:Fe-Mn family superoxide dismutase [Rugosibacter aromaticivorans]
MESNEVITTTGRDHPMMQDRYPILLNAVWENGYYLKYESRRPGYLKAWYSLVDWEGQHAVLILADNSAEGSWEEEDGKPLQTKLSWVFQSAAVCASTQTLINNSSNLNSRQRI